MIHLKVDGLLSKLESRYRSPYTIKVQDKKENHKDKKALGTLLKTVYPRHKTNVVPPEQNDDEDVEVDLILEHRRSPS